MQAEGVVEQLNELHADRLRIYDHFYEIVQKYKNNKVKSYLNRHFIFTIAEKIAKILGGLPQLC